MLRDACPGFSDDLRSRTQSSEACWQGRPEAHFSFLRIQVQPGELERLQLACSVFISDACPGFSDALGPLQAFVLS